MIIFKDRRDAGRQLAESLQAYISEEEIAQDILILALPRGGVPVAEEVVKALPLQTALDVFIVRKLGVPGNSEFAFGAVTQGGIMVLDKNIISAYGLSNETIQSIIDKETAEVERRIILFGANRHGPLVKDKNVFIIDDGFATGLTAMAAARALRLAKPKRLVFAVPVCSMEAAEQVSKEVDVLVALQTPEYFSSVGMFYENFEQVSDEEVLRILKMHQI